MRPFVIILFFAAIISSCNTNGKTTGTLNNGLDTGSKHSDHTIGKIYYPSGKRKATIAFNTNKLRDSISTYYNESGSVDSSKNYTNGKLNGESTTYYEDRKEVTLYKNDSVINFSVYDTDNFLEERIPLDTNMILQPKYRLTNGKDYVDKNIKDTMILIIDGVPPANRILSTMGAGLLRVDDTTYVLRAVNDKNSDSVKINIGIEIAQGSMIYKTIRLLKK
ncbi:MAG TPA: hypothetical protein VK718_05020 [Ferruginibacter sp.]|jgi:hypothetical protein|nr:hypothetical protein [Ferruginibacter sp.]